MDTASDPAELARLFRDTSRRPAVEARKPTLLDLSGVVRIVRGPLRPLLAALVRHRSARRASFMLLAGALTLLPFACGAELHLRRLARAEVPWEIAPYQQTLEPAGGMKVRSLWPALGYVQKLDARLPRLAHVNSWGFRDDPFEVPKPRDVARIVVVGDSMTYGLAVGDGALTFSGRLERMLNDRAPSGVRFDVMNLGIEGFQALQNDAMMRYVAMRRLEPDLVVYGFFVNDLADTSLDFYQYRSHYESGCDDVAGPPVYDLFRPTLFEHVGFLLKMHSSLFAEYRYRRGIFRYEVVLPMLDRFEQRIGSSLVRGLVDRVRHAWTLTAPCIEIADGYGYAILAIRDMGEVGSSAGIPVVLFKIPQAEFLGTGHSEPEDTFLDRFAHRGSPVRYVDPQPAMEARMKREGVPFRALCAGDNDCHPSVLGHDYLADALLQGMDRDGLVDELVKRVRHRTSSSPHPAS